MVNKMSDEADLICCPLCLEKVKEEDLYKTRIHSEWEASKYWFLCCDCYYGLLDMDHSKLPFIESLIEDHTIPITFRNSFKRYLVWKKTRIG